MRFQELPLEGAWIVEPERGEDERGFFARTVCVTEFAAQFMSANFVQSSISYNIHQGTVRGMHFQEAPHDEIKLVRCTAGAIYDVIVDIRPESITYRRWEAVELSAENRLALYIPAGLAHGFLTLRDATEVFYQISVPYQAEFARGFRWDDPAFGINWPQEIQMISNRDRAFSDFQV